MALPNGLPLNSDLGQLLSSLGSDALLSIPKVSVPFTTIQNRAQIYDLSKDLGTRMGVDRIQTQQIYQIQDEFGPDGEPVWGVVNDIFGQIRFVGSNWGNLVSTAGPVPVAIAGQSLNHYIEISFYGTGLNWLNSSHSGSDFRASVDGGVEGGSLLPASMSTAIGARNYSPNIIIPVVKGLTLGFHTVKIRANNAAAGMTVYGFEVLNESSSVTVNVGTSWKDGQKRYNATQSVLSYNSGFESGVLGTRGGRVAVYQKPDGSIGKAVQPTNNSQQNLTAADHSNEEVARVYSWREFGSGRTDDFSTLAGVASARAFTLDDGTTTLVGENQVQTSYGTEGTSIGAAGSTLKLTFVGTGLDVVRADAITTLDNHTVSVDGVSIGSLTAIGVASLDRVVKIISGLPYGTHTITFTRTTTVGGAATAFKRFIVYQPKTPTVPLNCSMIGAYNIMANYDSSAVVTTGITGHSQLPQGSLFKSIVRENTYVGANWAFGSIDATYASGIVIGTAANNNQPVSYTFFGTGFMLTLLASAGGTYDFSISLNGVLSASGVVKTNASNLGGGSYRSTSTTSGEPCRIEFTGLAIGMYTVTIQKTAGAGQWNYSGLHLITPVHSHKNNGPFVLQNTMSIGSQGVNSLAILPSQIDTKGVSTAVGVTSGPTSASATLIPVPDLSTTINCTTGRIKVSSFVTLRNNSLSASQSLAIFVNGQIFGPPSTIDIPVANNNNAHNIVSVLSVPIGINKIDIYHQTNAGTTTFAGVGRQLNVEEV